MHVDCPDCRHVPSAAEGPFLLVAEPDIGHDPIVSCTGGLRRNKAWRHSLPALLPLQKPRGTFVFQGKLGGTHLGVFGSPMSAPQAQANESPFFFER